VKPWADDIRQHIERWSGQLGNLNWWPRYVYHFTDVNNAVNILKERHLYSRTEAARRNLMSVDNASPAIIQQTQSAHLDYVRLYFRPLTPTQYRNEGIRPKEQRELDGAHCPVPVFFCFDAFTVLSMDETYFSNGNMGTSRVQFDNTREFFSQVPFDRVFHNRRFPTEERQEIVFRRNAEVLVPNQLPLELALKFIACRSVVERQTLLHLLPIGLASRWLSRIRAMTRLGEPGLFFRNWTYVEEVLTIDDRIIFRLNPDTYTPGPFEVKFTYQEYGKEAIRTWQGTRDILNSTLSFHFQGSGHRWGTATLYLDDALAFAGLILFEDIPF